MAGVAIISDAVKLGLIVLEFETAEGECDNSNLTNKLVLFISLLLRHLANSAFNFHFFDFVKANKYPVLNWSRLIWTLLIIDPKH